MEGTSIVEEVNKNLGDLQKHFSILGSFRDSAPKSLWMKVWCLYCWELLSLCLLKKNLKANLRRHLASSKHLQAMEAATNTRKRAASIFSGRRGRPYLSSGVSVYLNQPNLSWWWRPKSVAAETEPGEASTFDRNAILGSDHFPAPVLHRFFEAIVIIFQLPFYIEFLRQHW